jgi:RNA polymerase sigma-70 factor (family 1)
VSANEKDILLKVAQSDPAAFAILFKEYSPKVYTLGLSLTKSSSTAEEMVQEIFMKVWENRRQLSDIDFFKSWLRVICTNACYNHLRKKANERIAVLAYSGKKAETPPIPQDIVELKDFEGLIESAIRKLPPQQQKAFRLKKLSGKKTAEIAKEMNLSIYTVKEYLKAAQKAVKANLEVTISLLFLVFFN